MTTQQIIEEILKYFSSIEIDFDVYIVADTQNKTHLECGDKVRLSNETEFFSRQEFATIASAIVNVYGYVKVFYSELDFIQYVISKNIETENCLIFNYSRNGNFEGKKSLVPAFCDLLKLRYTGSNAFVISLLRNKYIFTKVVENEPLIHVPPTMIFNSKNNKFFEVNRVFENKKIIVKNIFESASIGLTKDCVFKLNEQTFNNLINQKEWANRDLLIQQFIEGTECEILVLQYKKQYYALDPIKIDFCGGNEMIDSIASNYYNYTFSQVSPCLQTSIKNIAIKIANILKIKDYARFDFRINNGVAYLIDIAGTPYTIFHSSIAYMFKYYNFNYDDIYKVIGACTISNYKID